MKITKTKLFLYFTLGAMASLGSVSQPSLSVDANANFGLVEEIYHSHNHTIIRNKENKYFGIGDYSSGNGWGAFYNRANGGYTSVTEITANMPALQNGETIEKLSLGYEYNLLLTSTGRVLASGNNANGQIGNGTTDPFYGVDVPFSLNTSFSLQGNETIIDVEASRNYLPISVALSSNNRVWVWGANQQGEQIGAGSLGIGNGNTNPKISTPTEITSSFTDLGQANLKGFAFTPYTSYAMTDSNFLYAWGRNNKGLLGVGSNDETLIEYAPRKIDLSTILNNGETIVSIQTSFQFNSSVVVLLTSQNRLIGWGFLSNLVPGSSTAFIDTPSLLDMTNVNLRENETITKLYYVQGIFLATNQNRIFFNGSPIIQSLANILPNRNTYLQNPYFIDATISLPVLEAGDFIKDIYGSSTVVLILLDSGKLLMNGTSGFSAPDHMNLLSGTPSFLSGIQTGISYYLFIGENTEPFDTYVSGETFKLPKQTAPEGYYHQGWSLNKEGPSYGGGVDYQFTYTYNSNVRVYPIFVQGVDPSLPSSSATPSSQTPSSTTPSSNPTTSQTPSSSTTVSSTPTTSTPASSIDGGDDTPNSPIVPILLVSAAVGGAGVGGWLFVAKGASIGGFSYVALKKWLVGFFKRDRKDKGK